MKTLRFMASAAIVVLSFAGCGSESRVNSVDSALPQHSSVSAYMKQVMHEMNNVLYERHQSELERDESRQRYALRLADKIAVMSKEIRSYPKERSMNSGHTHYFGMLVDQLAEDGEKIRRYATEFRMEKLEASIESMTHTCKTCHTTFNTRQPEIN